MFTTYMVILQVMLWGPSWITDIFHFKNGIFQGDPISPRMFAIVFNFLIQIIKSKIKFCYELNVTKNISTPFADDFDLIITYSKNQQ